MNSALDDQSLDQIFRSARTPNGWADRPVEDDTREIHDLMKWGPTSANSSPAPLFGCIAPTERQRSPGLLRTSVGAGHAGVRSSSRRHAASTTGPLVSTGPY